MTEPFYGNPIPYQNPLRYSNSPVAMPTLGLSSYAPEQSIFTTLSQVDSLTQMVDSALVSGGTNVDSTPMLQSASTANYAVNNPFAFSKLNPGTAPSMPFEPPPPTTETPSESEDEPSSEKKEMTLETALDIIKKNFKAVETSGGGKEDGLAGFNDLERIAKSTDDKHSEELKAAAQYFLDHKGEFDEMEKASDKEKKQDSKFTMGDIDKYKAEKFKNQDDK